MTGLNEQQMAAVTAEEGPALVLAGAGSGKTRVIIERLVWLVEERGVDPRALLALTFTNKAADEMRRRLAQRLGMERAPAWLGTFHSFGLYVLRRDIERLGRKNPFTIFDDSDQLGLMKRLVRALPPDQAQLSPRQALSWISDLKQRLEKPGDDANPILARLWKEYHAALVTARAVDFDDLLALTVALFEAHPDALARYQRRFKHVLVDEYQDTNHAQYRIVRALCAEHENVFVVGDEDQSIYAWRGADVRNILDFAKDFPKAATYRLERNYRSAQPILDAANAVVANNLNRLGKRLWTTESEGEPVRFNLVEDGAEEARWVIGDIARRELAPREAAILYRTNTQARVFEDALRAKGLHYAVTGGLKFYSRKEIKDVLAYLRLLINSDDDEALRRVLNLPPRGIGGRTLEQIEDNAKLRRAPLFSVLRDSELDETFSARARRSMAEFTHLVDDLAVEAKTSDVGGLVENLLERIKFREYLEQSDEKDFRSRLDNLEEFVVACRDFDKNAGGEKRLLDFLLELALLSDVDTVDLEAPAVMLMTVHAAKGLEFDHVYLVGMEEGLLPFGVVEGEERDIEEERRLCYVAMTRARKSLTLTAAQSRMLYGTTRADRVVSRFVGEIGGDKLRNVHDVPRKPARPAANAPVDGGRMKTGTRVRHAKFGPGVVMYTAGAGPKLKARIRFNTGRVLMIMVSQAPLEILEGKSP